MFARPLFKIPGRVPAGQRLLSHTTIRNDSLFETLRKHSTPNAPVALPNADTELVKDSGSPSTTKTDAGTPGHPASTITKTEKKVFTQIISSRLPLHPHRRAPLSRDEILALYPTPLRAVIEKRLVTDEDEAREAAQTADVALTAEQMEKDEEVRVQQAAEMERIGEALRGCRVDTDVWRVLEEQVFSLVGKMGLDKPRWGMCGEGGNEGGGTAESADEIQRREAEKSEKREMLEVYGPRFAGFVLVAAKHLNYSFATPSPLILSILPRLRDLGLPTFVLGTTASLYEEVLRASWALHSSVPELLNILKDMSHADVKPRKGTLAVVEEILKEIMRVRGAGGIAEGVVTGVGFDAVTRGGLKKVWEKMKLDFTKERGMKEVAGHIRSVGFESLRGGSGGGRGGYQGNNSQRGGYRGGATEGDIDR